MDVKMAEFQEQSVQISSSCSLKVGFMGAGLVNLGNTCFLNAVLQCLTHTPILVKNLLSLDHASSCKRNNGAFCVICALKEHVALSLSSSGSVISPLYLVENLAQLSPSFQRYEQEDAHEFLQCLLDNLHRCCTVSNSEIPLSSSPSDDSFVYQIFGGRLVSKLRCCNCGHCSDNFEPLIDLSLEIDDIESLSSALKSFTSVERIEDPDNKLRCENCKEEVCKEKKILLDQVPPILTIHLKRFKTDGFSIEKIGNFVDYPLQIDFQSFAINPDGGTGKLEYELYALVVHSGLSSSYGHYFSYVRLYPKLWFKVDDTYVGMVSEQEALSQEAYILFYARQGLVSFSNLMEIQNKIDQTLATSPNSVLDVVENDHGSSSSPSLIDRRSNLSSSDSGSDCYSPRMPFNEGGRDPVPGTPPCSEMTSNDEDSMKNLCRSPPSPEFYFEKDIAINCNKRQGHPSTSNNDIQEPVTCNNIVADGRTKESLNKLMKNMPSSRRSSFLSCFHQSQGWPQNHQNQNLTESNKKRRLDRQSCEEVSSRKPLSPRSIMFRIGKQDAF